MITLEHVHSEIHDKVSNNDKVYYSFIKKEKNRWILNHRDIQEKN